VTLFAGVAGMLLAHGAAAHPHVFIKHSMILIFGDHDIAGVRMTWIFDEMYSSMIKSDYTKARNGSVTPDDVKTIERDNFSNLANYGFFIDLKINGEPVKVGKVKDFDAEFRDNRAVFRFTVPLATKEPQAPNVIEIGAFDPEYYVEFTMLDKDPMTIDHGDGFAVDCNILRNERKISVLGPIDTDLAECTYAAKPK
jgi:ABC-type uncharacterized transport system substrate-binding protein